MPSLENQGAASGMASPSRLLVAYLPSYRPLAIAERQAVGAATVLSSLRVKTVRPAS